jgi:uncharacterized protein YbaR (Trm112 family)
MNNHYRNSVACPVCGHKFYVMRWRSSAGQMRVTYCPGHGGRVKMMAKPIIRIEQ